MPPDIPPGATTNGTTNTLKIQRYSTPIKIEFIVGASQPAFNLAKAHHEILKLLQAKDPTIEIVPSKEGKATFKDLVKFPATEKEYNEHFDHAVQKEPTEARKILVRHSLLTNVKFSDLKFQNARLMDHMFKNRIYLKYNQTETLEIAALGFIQDVHPRITFRDSFSHNLSEAIHLEMTDAEKIKLNELLPAPKNQIIEAGEMLKPDIKLEAVARTIGFGNGDSRIKTEAFEIRVPLAIRLIIKEIMTRLGNAASLPTGRFIPYGLVQSVGSDVYKKMLVMQNVFLANFRTIPVFGLTPNALNHVINIDETDGTRRPMTVKQFILSQPSIHGLETTNRADDLGKVFVKSDATNILNARAFVDTVIKQLYESGAIPQEMILEAFNPPRRGDAPRTSNNFQSYASILANLGNPQEDGQAIPPGGQAPPPRPPKRNVQMVYDLTTEFPNLPRRNNQNKQNQQEPQAKSQTINSDNQTAGSTITNDTLAQLREEMKNEFMTMIQQEVKTQIQIQMKELQQEVSKIGTEVQRLTATIGGMQEGISASIGATVRDAISQSMTSGRLNTQPSTYPTENTQDGACPMLTGTES